MRVLWRSCDALLYESVGVTGYHPSCSENFRKAAVEVGWTPLEVPDPVNFFQNTTVSAAVELSSATAPTKADDHVILRAEMDLVIIVTACSWMFPAFRSMTTSAQAYVSRSWAPTGGQNEPRLHLRGLREPVRGIRRPAEQVDQSAKIHGPSVDRGEIASNGRHLPSCRSITATAFSSSSQASLASRSNRRFRSVTTVCWLKALRATSCGTASV